MDYGFCVRNVAQFETRRGKYGVVENTGWEGRGEIHFPLHVTPQNFEF
jgi:hypothetical protein